MTMRMWVVLLMACVGCGGPDPMPDVGTGEDGGPIPARPDAGGACFYECFGLYVCEGGVVLRYDTMLHPISCHAPFRCEGTPVLGPSCTDGCVEGMTSPTLDALCNENQARRVGDACETDEDCQPGGTEPDGFGGIAPVTLRCELTDGGGACARVEPERCNAVDDDGDGDTDEDCSAIPRVVGTSSSPGLEARFVFASTRIGAVSGFAGEEVVTVYDELGARVGDVEADITDYQDLTSDGEALLVLLHAPYGATAEILVLAEDASVARRITLSDVPSVRYLGLRALEGQWLVYGTDTLSRHAADGTRTDSIAVGLSWPDLEIARLDGGLLATASFDGTPYPLPVSVPLMEVTRPDRASVRIVSRFVRLGDTILGASGDGGTELIQFGSTDGLERARRRVLARPALRASLALTLAGDRAALSWLEDGTVRTMLLDASATDVGHTELDLGGPGAERLYGGEMLGGARVIAVGSGSFTLLAPADPG